ncbi:hypothetical protein GIB67_039729 [Kingdonia uniflora]|uniref:Uncharacterized protein n=1 Tax=Kingdonia uniflora TaxID=39325 RepID=A0A7J7MQH2_9MAGN|nr:hypothetical protein GIB67_039729 [Kingdonia uniflora]
MERSSSSPPLQSGGGGGERKKKHWWLTKTKVFVIGVLGFWFGGFREIASALDLLDAALILCPCHEAALELKARCLLYLRRFKEVADMLQQYIPSFEMVSRQSSHSLETSSQRLKLLSSDNPFPDSSEYDPSFKCLSISDLKKMVMAGLKKSKKEGRWRYLVLGQACYHLGLLEDAMVLLQTGKRLAAAAFQRDSTSWSRDSFSSNKYDNVNNNLQTPTESGSLSLLLTHIKFLLCRRTVAISALNAGLNSEAIRQFSKILDSRRGTPHGFAAECYIKRAEAYRADGRIADSLSDCNRTLSLDPISIEALTIRAGLLETIRSLQDCLRDLQHLKLLYNTILRDRKLPGPAWKQHNVQYQDIPHNLVMLTSKIQELGQRVASGETANVDYYTLLGLRRGCSRSELGRAHVLLTLRQGPEKATNFIDRCEFLDYRNLDSVKDQARMSSLLLYRLLQKGYSYVMATIKDEEEAERQRKKAAEAKFEEEITKSTAEIQIRNQGNSANYKCTIEYQEKKNAAMASAFQGVFCRDIATVGNLLSRRAAFTHSIPVTYEALSC